MPYVILNGELLPESEARIPLEDRGFLFGDGVFETIAVHQGVPYQWELHLARLQAGLAELQIPFQTNDLFKYASHLIEKNQLTEGILRLHITRGAGSRGYLPTGNTPTCLLQTRPAPQTPDAPVGLWVSTYEKISPRALPVQHKLAQGLNSTLARMEAQKHGCFEALQLNANGEICEASSANIFWYSEGILHTPTLECGLLAGTTRAALLRLRPLPMREGTYTLNALQSAECVFLTNTAWKILPVAELTPQGWKFDADHPVIAECKTALQDDINQYINSHQNPSKA